MQCVSHGLLRLLAPLCLVGIAGAASAADLTAPAPAGAAAVTMPEAWTFRFVPYGWLMSLKGSQTVRGRTTKVNASFIDVINDTVGRGGTLIGLMGDFEARKGPWSLFTDLVWTKVGVEGSHVRTRSLVPGVSGTVGVTLAADVQMAILEAGAAYEVVRSGPLAIDLLAGGRYWSQDVSLSFNRAQTLDVADLELRGARAVAKSGSVDWLDPLIGARVRYAVAPGQEVFLRGDIGGFGVGSKASWQAVGGYSFDFATYQGITFSGVIGYRALYVDYAQGEGRGRYEFDMLIHGPVLGISARF